MRIHWRTEGFIVKKADRGESDRIFTVFTKEFGKLDLWAVSERKITSKLRGGLETLCVSEFEFIQGRSKKTLTDAFLLEQHNGIKNNLIKLRVAFRIAETLDMFLKGETQDLKIWNLLQDSFAALRSKTLKLERCALVYYYFFWNLVSYLGWRPHMKTYTSEETRMLAAFLGGSTFLSLQDAVAKFSTKSLNEISRRYFVEIQKELQ